MRSASSSRGYTLVEVIVAIVIFAAAGIALAASSALVARAMATNALRERGARIGVSRIEVIKSQCAIAASGHETIQRMESDWTVTAEASRVRAVESVHCLSAPATCTTTYQTVTWCRR